ncbi:MAG: DNA polymerase/3'-5' exonuclease PolX [Cyclobacteriaceae bacterium]
MLQNQNKELARIFDEMATIYEFLGFENRFRVMAYRKASYVIGSLPEAISHYQEKGKLEDVPGVGISIAAKIREYLRTGKISKYEKLKTKVPHDFIGLLKVKGMGPETLKRFHRELGINTKTELITALEDGRVESLEGFKEKKVKNILNGLRQKELIEKRIVLWDALEVSEMMKSHLEKLPEVERIAVAGSIRRAKETIGDVDLLIQAKDNDRKKILDHFVGLQNVEKVLLRGNKKASVLIKEANRQVDLRIFRKKEWGAGLLYFTGSKEHNIHLRKIAIEKGLKVNEYGIFDLRTNEYLAGASEEEMYAALGLVWVPPEMRVEQGEIMLAETKKLPKLVTLKDVKGDLQMHSNWSDGTDPIEELARYVKGSYTYEYIVLTDHSKSTRVARGLNEEQFEAQIETIKKVNAQLGVNFVKAGAEVDILTDGSLDLPDRLLEKLDWVVASIHSQLNRDNTQRLIKACQHPLVHVIGHPTGRLIGTRESYPLDVEAVIQAASSTGTALEINAQPLRMDLNDRLASRARELKVALVISTDSHQKGNFAFMSLGVAIARRAWCTKRDILNTRNWTALEKFKATKKKKAELQQTNHA